MIRVSEAKFYSPEFRTTANDEIKEKHPVLPKVIIWLIRITRKWCETEHKFRVFDR